MISYPTPVHQQSDYRTYYVQSWGISLLLHGLAVGSTVLLLSDLKLEPQPEPFRWEVSLVQPVEESQAEAPPAVHPPAKPAAERPVEPEPVVKPIEQQTIVETVRQVEQVQPTVREVPQQEVREVKPVVETLPQPVAVVSRPVETQKPLSEPESVVVASAPPAPVVSQQAETRITEVSTTPASVAEQPPVKEVVKEAPAPPAPALEARIKEPDRPASPSPALVQEAKAAPPMPAARTHVKKDFGWLAKTLWDRVVHLKRYPHAARMHHIEGRVVVRAVIREDGHLVEAAVLQSSGHEVLDHDALEIVRRACPLKLARELGRPEVVVQVPISYKLEN